MPVSLASTLPTVFMSKRKSVKLRQAIGIRSAKGDVACRCRFLLRSWIPNSLAELDVIDLRIQKSLIFITPVWRARHWRNGRFEAGELSIGFSKIIDLETDMIDAYFGKNDFSFHNHAGAATMAKI